MKNRKVFVFAFLFLIPFLCFSQTKRSILGFSLGETKNSINQRLTKENYVQKSKDTSKEIYPITLEIFSKSDLTYNKIPVEHITFSYCYDKLFCISIVTKPIDDLEVLTNSRKIIKQEYNFEKRNRIEIDDEFYDKNSNPAFYSCKDNNDFILVIYGKEDYRGNIPQCYNYIYKSKADEAIELKNSYQKYSKINGYTEMSLDELKHKSLTLKQEEEEKQKQLTAQKLEEEKQKEITRKQQQEEYNRKHRFDKFMGGFSAGFLGGGGYNGTNSGGFGAFDFSYNIAGPFSIGVDWRIGSIKPNDDKDYGELRMDLDAYLALGLKIPTARSIIYVAAAPGGFLYQEKDTSYHYSDKYEGKIEGFIDLRTGIIFPIFSDWDMKFVYSREITKNNVQMNLFTFLIGGRFF